MSKSQKKKLMIITILLVGSIFLEFFGIGLLIPIMAIVLSPDYLESNVYYNMLSLFLESNKIISIKYFIIFSTLIFYLLKSVYVVLFHFKQNNFLANLNSSLSSRLYHKYSFSQYSSLKSKGTAEMYKNIKVEANATVAYLTALLNFVSEALILLAIISLLFIFDFKTTLIISIVIALFSAIFIKAFKFRINWLGNERQALDDLISKRLLDYLNGINDIIQYQKQSFFLINISKLFNKKASIDSSYSTINVLPKIFLELLVIIITIGSIIYMMYNNFDPGLIGLTIGIYASASFKIMPSISKLMVSGQSLKFYEPALNLYVNEINSSNSKISNSNHKISFNTLSISSLNFKYDHNEIVFENANFEVSKTDFIGLQGNSGSGKSTLTSILVGFLVDFSAHVFLNGERVNQSLSFLRSIISYVPQKVFLFNDNIKNNITFGEDFDIDFMNKILLCVGLISFKDNTRDILNTNVGESGSNLSGGQSQRVVIARALFKNPEILILDESLSGLETKMGEEILTNIRNHFDNITIILISHNLSYYKLCNKIYEISNKRIKLIKNE